MRARMEEICDQILTAHEHDDQIRYIRLTSSQQSTYQEAGAMQLHGDSSQSTFRVSLVDLGTRRMKSAAFNWTGIRFEPEKLGFINGGTLSQLWDEFPISQVRDSQGEFTPNTETNEYLEDLGVNLTKDGRTKVSLPQIFVFPDLREYDVEVDRVGPGVRGDRVAESLLGIERALVMGDEGSGKTALAKMMFRASRSAGFVPVLLNGSEGMGGRSAVEYVERGFVRQYGEEQLEAFRQLEPHRKLVIVDDFDRLPTTGKRGWSFVDGLNKAYGRVMLFADPLRLGASELFNPQDLTDSTWSYRSMSIAPLGHVRRDQLIQRWLALDEDMSPADLVRNRTQLATTLNTLTATGWLPPFPVYVLAVFQQNESVINADTRISTHGAYYEMFIRAPLLRGKTQRQYNITVNLLSYLAYHAYDTGKDGMLSDDFTHLFDEFKRRYALTTVTTPTMNELIGTGVLSRSGDELKFKYPYMFYYLVAAWIRDNIGEPEVVAEVRKLASSLHVDRSAGILQFLARLSKDRVVVDALLEAARSFYPEAAPARLEDDVVFLDSLEPVVPQLVLEEEKAEASRKQHLELLDAAEQDEESGVVSLEPENWSEAMDSVQELNAAFQTLNILGQILRNFPGNLESEPKFVMASEIYSLGLRTLGTLLGLMEVNRQEVVLDTALNLHRRLPDLSSTQLEARAKGVIVSMSRLLGLGVVRLIGHAVGARELQPTYERVLRDIDSAATQFINISIRLETGTEFPIAQVEALASRFRANQYSHRLLAALTLMHLDAFHQKEPMKNRACSAVGIKFVPRLGADRRPKRLGSGI